MIYLAKCTFIASPKTQEDNTLPTDRLSAQTPSALKPQSPLKIRHTWVIQSTSAFSKLAHLAPLIRFLFWLALLLYFNQILPIALLLGLCMEFSWQYAS